MSRIFLEIINMSISASYITLAIILLRLILKKAPKFITVLLWGVVALRLVLPFSVESVFSLIPSVQTVSPDIMTNPSPTIESGIPIVNNAINPIFTGAFSPALGDSANPLQIWIPVLTSLWILGMIALLAYAIISYAHLRHKVRTAVRVGGNIYRCERVISPFVLGFIRPKIYLPLNIEEKDEVHVIAHEKAHISRGDTWWKPIGFFLLTVHWFNPLLWLAYVLLCRDIELACDEKVIKKLGRDERAEYSEALISCSVGRRMIAACPLAFGEVSIKRRVKSVLNYKKPAFWIILAAAASCIALAVCFLTNPISNESDILKKYEMTPASDITGKYKSDETVINKEYFELKDGTWRCGQYDYKYRLELNGTASAVAESVTYTVLSNVDDIDFDDASREASAQQCGEIYFEPADSVIVAHQFFSFESAPLSEELGSLIYTSEKFDIDADGELEYVRIFSLPTGSIWFALCAYSADTYELKYANYTRLDELASYTDFSFDKCSDGVMRLRGTNRFYKNFLGLFDVFVLYGEICLSPFVSMNVTKVGGEWYELLENEFAEAFFAAQSNSDKYNVRIEYAQKWLDFGEKYAALLRAETSDYFGIMSNEEFIKYKDSKVQEAEFYYDEIFSGGTIAASYVAKVEYDLCRARALEIYEMYTNISKITE